MGWTREWYGFSLTAESFGVSAQIGSRVVRGGPEVRFHGGSARVPPGFHQVPPGFHQGSTRVPPGFHQRSTKVPPSTRVTPGFHQFHQGSTRDSRVPRCSGGLRGGASTEKSTEKSTACCWGYHLSLFYFFVNQRLEWLEKYSQMMSWLMAPWGSPKSILAGRAPHQTGDPTCAGEQVDLRVFVRVGLDSDGEMCVCVCVCVCVNVCVCV